MEVDIRTHQTISFRAAVPSAVVTCIFMVLEMRDGDTSKLLDKGIRKAVVNINDTIAHKLLGVDVWEHAEIDNSTAETLDGTKNEWGLSEVSLYTYISKLTVKPSNIVVVCPEIMIVPTGVGSFVEAMTTFTEDYHTL